MKLRTKIILAAVGITSTIYFINATRIIMQNMILSRMN